MAATHMEFLVEEPSMEAFLCAMLPRILNQGESFKVHVFQGKSDLLGKLESRLKGYAKWIPSDWRIFVVVDRDDDDCLHLKDHLETAASRAGLRTRAVSVGQHWSIANRIAIEELESWYFGEWASVQQAYPRVSKTIPMKSQYRECDAIRGGTWEAFERVMQSFGYFKGGLTKIEAARRIGEVYEPLRSSSRSFAVFHEAILEALDT